MVTTQDNFDHQQLGQLFERALTLPPERRAEFVAEQCPEAPALREDLLSLLVAHDRGGHYLEELASQTVEPVTAAIAHRAGMGAVSGDSLESLQERLAGAYRLERELGGGGMSRVFVAEDLKLGRRVVVKLLSPAMLPTPDIELFRREISVAARLQHPHIVPLHAAESAHGLVYYTMPYVDGRSLREQLASTGPLALADALRIWRDVVDAIAHAHGSGLVHRDIKPGNVLLSGRHALVTDFGIAHAIEHASRDGQAAGSLALGTPAYMAPEQAAGSGGADKAVDIFQAGLVMYEMLSGDLPYPRASGDEMLRARAGSQPRPLERADVPARLSALVMRCLNRDPAKRPGADALLAEIDDQAASDATLARGALGLRRLPLALAPTVAALAIVAWTAYASRHAPPAATALSAATPAPAIAVLPIAAAAEDTSGAAIADGMTQELISVIARTRGLRVVPATSVASLDYRHMSAPQIADALQISHLLEGSIARDGSRLHVRMRLVDARADATRWSKTIDRDFADIFDVEDEIVTAVADELTAHVKGLPEPARSVRRTASAAAYEWYLRGMNVALIRNAAGRRQSAEHFSKAIAIDPKFSSAHAGLANTYLLQAYQATLAEQSAFYELGRQEAYRAIALDDTDPNGHLALGWTHFFRKDLRSTEAEFRRALELDPKVQRGYESLARIFMFTGRAAEQLAAAHQGLEVEPFSHSAIREYALALASNGRCAESLGQLQGLKDLDPPAQVAGVLKGLCYISLERWPEAIAELRWATEQGAGLGPAFLGFALARAGRREEAERILADLLVGRESSQRAFGMAMVYAGLRDFDRAFEWLDRSMDDNTSATYLWHPALATLRSDTRFARIRKQFGLDR